MSNEVSLNLNKQQKQLQDTPAANNQPKKKPVSLFSSNMLLKVIKSSLSEAEYLKFLHGEDYQRIIREEDWDKSNGIANIFEDICDKADTEDLYGKKFNDNEMNDSIFNEKEQNVLLQMLKEKLPVIYNIVNDYVQKLQNKSETEIVANNISLKQIDPGMLLMNNQVVSYSIGELNNDNLMAISKDYPGLSLLFELYADAFIRSEEEIRENFNPEDYMYMVEEGEELTGDKLAEAKAQFELDKNNSIQIKEGGLKDLRILKEKSLNYANHLIRLARENDIYSKDYEQALEKAINEDNLKNITIYTQRLSDRIFMTLDKDKKTVNASKRAIELKEPNGQVDSTFVQGYTGDCWFLSSLKSMCGNKDVLERINNMITVNKDGDNIVSVTVNIQGKDYTIDYKNLKDANEYATGDLDARALEMAVNQYVHENNTELSDITLGGDAKDAYVLLFGEDNVEITEYKKEADSNAEEVADEDSEDDDSEEGVSLATILGDVNDFDVERYLKILEKADGIVISTIGIYGSMVDEGEKIYAEDLNGNPIEIKRQHAYNYTRIDDKYFYFTDPHAPEKELRVLQEKVGDIFDGACTVKIKDNNNIASL